MRILKSVEFQPDVQKKIWYNAKAGTQLSLPRTHSYSCTTRRHLVYYTWIRVEGSITEDTRREARVAMTEGNTASLSSMYTVDDNLIAVFAFDNGVATIYSFTDEPKEIKF